MRFLDEIIIDSGSITGSLEGTSSYSNTSSFSFTASFSATSSRSTTSSYAEYSLSSSFALTASYISGSILNPFPYTGSGNISGSLNVVGPITGDTISGQFIGSLPLSNGRIFVGNASNLANAVTPSGDVSISNTGVTTIENDKVTTDKILNNNVTYTKIQNITGDRLLGRTGTTGTIQEITLGTGLSFSGTTLNASATGGSITDGDKGDITVSSSGSVWTIDNSSVSYSKIQDVSNNKILGRYTSGSGSIEEISLGSNLTINSGILTLTSGIGSYSFPFNNQSTINIAHNLNVEFPIVQVYNDISEMIIPETVKILDNNNVRVILPNTISGNITIAKGGHIISGSTITNAVSASYADYIQSPAVRTHRVYFGISSPAVITTGRKGLKTIGQEGRIVGWRLLSDISTTCVLDIWKLNGALPTNDNSITNPASKPSLSNSTFNSSTSLSGWSVLFSPNDVFAVEVESNNLAKYLYLELDFLVDNN